MVILTVIVWVSVQIKVVLVPPPTHLFTTATEQIVTAPPQVLLNVPPPQILPQTQIVLTQQVSCDSLSGFKLVIVVVLGAKCLSDSTHKHSNNCNHTPTCIGASKR